VVDVEVIQRTTLDGRVVYEARRTLSKRPYAWLRVALWYERGTWYATFAYDELGGRSLIRRVELDEVGKPMAKVKKLILTPPEEIFGELWGAGGEPCVA